MMNLKKHIQTYERNGIYETWSFVDLVESSELASNSDFFVVSPTGVTNVMRKNNAIQYDAKSAGFTHVGKDYVLKMDEKYQEQISSMGSRS